MGVRTSHPPRDDRGPDGRARCGRGAPCGPRRLRPDHEHHGSGGLRRRARPRQRPPDQERRVSLDLPSRRRSLRRGADCLGHPHALGYAGLRRRGGRAQGLGERRGTDLRRARAPAPRSRGHRRSHGDRGERATFDDPAPRRGTARRGGRRGGARRDPCRVPGEWLPLGEGRLPARSRLAHDDRRLVPGGRGTARRRPHVRVHGDVTHHRQGAARADRHAQRPRQRPRLHLRPERGRAHGAPRAGAPLRPRLAPVARRRARRCRCRRTENR